MTPMRRQPGLIGPDMPMMGGQAPMQFAALPPMLDGDASGAQAIGGLTNLAGALQAKMMNGGPSAGPTDAPMRRKTPFMDAAAMSGPNYA